MQVYGAFTNDSASAARKIYHPVAFIMDINVPGQETFITDKYLKLSDKRLYFSGGGTGSLVPPVGRDSGTSGNQSPTGSPTKAHSHSAHTSPTNTAKLRPRARSAESDTKKLPVSCSDSIMGRERFSD